MDRRAYPPNPQKSSQSGYRTRWYLTIAFNISPLQLRDLTLPDQIREIAVEAEFPLSRLIVEITESALIDDMEVAIAVVDELKAMGCKLALDDFGTGYSSLRHLQSLPFDELKVDRSFVSSMTEKRDSRKIVSAIVGLGQSLGLTTVGEGIETREQAEMMMWLGCDLGQGYYFGRPMPPQELAGWISTQAAIPLLDDTRTRTTISLGDLESSPSRRLAQLQAVYDGAPIGLAFVDHNLRFINLNKKLAEINGASVESHLGASISEMIPEMYPYVEPYLKRALGGEAVLNIEVRNSLTGETRLINYQPAFDEASEVVGVALAISDVAVRKPIKTKENSESHNPSKSRLNAQPRLDKSLEHQTPEVSATHVTVAGEANLKLHEIVALNLIAQCASPNGMGLGELAREMHKAGLVQAASLAISSLRQRNFIVRKAMPSTQRDADKKTRLFLTPSGHQWWQRNPQLITTSSLHTKPSIEPSGLIDFLSTLRFRA